MKRSHIILLVAFMTLISISCKSKDKELQSESVNNSNEEASVEVASNVDNYDDSYRPSWWKSLNEDVYIFSYNIGDGADLTEAKQIAVDKAQKRFLHVNKGYVINLTSKILHECDSASRFKMNRIRALNSLVFEYNYSKYFKVIQTESLEKNDDSVRCFVVVGFPKKELHKIYVDQVQKRKTIAKWMAKSETYKKILKEQGVEALELTAEEEAVAEKPQIDNTKYNDIVPSWFKISQNNKKIMVNKFAVDSNKKRSISKAYKLCKDNTKEMAVRYSKEFVESFRAETGYNELEFQDFKRDIKNEIMSRKINSQKERDKTIQIAQDKYKTYSQFYINKAEINNIIIDVIRRDEVLHSKLKSFLAFQEMDGEF